jgi:guanylate kinase
LFIISAPSGSGKSTLVSRLLSLVGGLEFSISYTTRAMRGSERDGREYHFVTREKFEAMIEADEFLEWAEVFGNYYGTAALSLEQAESKGNDLLLDIDVQGGLQVMERLPEAVSVFILPPSPEVLEKRLRQRSEAEKMRDEAVIEKRLQAARAELRYLGGYRYAIINDVLDDAEAELRAIVLWTRHGMKQENGETLREMAASCETAAASERLQRVLHSFGLG